MISQTVIFAIIVSIIVLAVVIFGVWYLVRAILESRRQKEELESLTSEINLPIIN